MRCGCICGCCRAGPGAAAHALPTPPAVHCWLLLSVPFCWWLAASMCQPAALRLGCSSTRPCQAAPAPTAPRLYRPPPPAVQGMEQDHLIELSLRHADKSKIAQIKAAALSKAKQKVRVLQRCAGGGAERWGGGVVGSMPDGWCCAWQRFAAFALDRVLLAAYSLQAVSRGLPGGNNTHQGSEWMCCCATRAAVARPQTSATYPAHSCIHCSPTACAGAPQAPRRPPQAGASPKGVSTALACRPAGAPACSLQPPPQQPSLRPQYAAPPRNLPCAILSACIPRCTTSQRRCHEGRGRGQAPGRAAS